MNREELVVYLTDTYSSEGEHSIKEKYLESDHEAKKYPNKGSYEEIRDRLTDDPVSLAIPLWFA